MSIENRRVCRFWALNSLTRLLVVSRPVSSGVVCALYTGGMEMESLRSLYSSMCRHKMDRARFVFVYNGQEIDAVFFIDENPYVLMLSRAPVGAVVVDVKKGFCIKTYLGSQYDMLCRVLAIEPHGAGKFQPNEFFAYLDSRVIPHDVSPVRNECRPEHAVARFSDVEESEKVYFCGLIDWGQHRGNHRPSEQNLRKTAELLGARMGNLCRRKHISTKWTADPSGLQARATDQITRRIEAAPNPPL